MMEWKEVNICQMCDTISDTYKGCSDEVVLINTSDVLDGKCLNHEYVENKNLKGQFKKTFKKDDILYSEIRPANKRFCYVDFDPKDYIASTKLMVLRHHDNINPQFLYQLLRSNNIILQLQTLAESRSGTFPQITYSEFANIKVKLPSKKVQDRIVSILSSLDRKIELNNKINAVLEEMAQAIFKSWFVDSKEFDFHKLSDLTSNITDGVHNTVQDEKGSSYYLLSCKNIIGGKLAISSNERTISKETFLKLRKRTKLEKGDILVSTVGTIGEILLLTEEPNNIEFQRSVGIIKANKQIVSPYYIYFALKHNQRKLKHSAHGAVQQCIFISDLKDFEIPVGEADKIMQFDLLVEPIIRNIANNQKESLHLAQLRDTLLPKLMSGEIEV